jgi:hypothetical protein
MLGKISLTTKDHHPIFEPIVIKEKEVPILTGFVEPAVGPQVKKEEVKKAIKRPQTAFSAIGSESVER